MPALFEVSEPHLAVAPYDPHTLYAVATSVGTELDLGCSSAAPREATWTASSPIESTSATTRASTPIPSSRTHSLQPLRSLALNVDGAACTALLHVGTRVSHDHGATFGGYGSADEAILPLCLFFCCPPPPDLESLDTP